MLAAGTRIKNLADLLNLLRTTFPPPNVYEYQEQFFQRQQAFDEPLSTYLHSMLLLWLKASSISEAEAVRLTIRNANGMDKTTLKCIHSATPFKSINEMLIKARDLDTFDSSNNPNAEISLFKSIVCSYCKKQGHHISDCRNRPAKQIQPSEPPQPTSAPTSNDKPKAIQLAIDPDQYQESEAELALTAAKRPYVANNTYYRPSFNPNYSLTEDLERTRANITFAQLLRLAPTLRNDSLLAPANPSMIALSYQAVTAPVKINGIQVQAVLDSGAALSIIREDLAKSVNTTINKSKTQRLLDVHNNTESSAGTAENVIVELGGCKEKLDMVILKNSPSPIILGTDWSHKVGAILDYKNNKISLSKNDSHFEENISFTKQQNNQTHQALHVSIAECESKDSPKGLPFPIYEQYCHLFSSTCEIQQHSHISHKISLTDNTPVNIPSYRLSRAEHAFVQQQVAELIKSGRIVHSTSPYSAPVVIIRKKNGTLRLCIDYRRLNAKTIKDAYPLPQIDFILDQFSGSQFFSTMDLSNGYWQIPINEADRPKTAFSTSLGHFEWTVMPFGLCNAPATFQRMMNLSFSEFIGKFVFIYLDDIIIYSPSVESHTEHIHQILNRIDQVNLRLNPTKCLFFQDSVKFLGHVVSKNGISPDQSKIEAIYNIPTPNTIKELQSFLGLANYYRRFVKNYAHIAKPLHELTKSMHTFLWNTAHQVAFNSIKEKLATAPVRHHPDMNQPFILHTDASSVALGAVLAQSNGAIENVVNYNSRILNKHERNYSATELECLAVIWAIKINRPYLALSTFTVYTDHKALEWLHNNKDLNGKLMRWSLLLQNYDFSIKYRPGKHNIADVLSRIDLNPTTTKILLSDTVNTNLESQIQDAHISCGHGGLGPTLHILDPANTNPQLRKLACEVIRQCTTCKMYNPRCIRQKPIAIFSAGPFHRLIIDTVGPIKPSRSGNTFIIIAIDHFTRWIEASAAKDKTAKTIVEFLISSIILRHGAPSILQSDNGTEFDNSLVNKLCQYLEVVHKFSSPYRPQTNGMVEKANHTVVQKLSKIAHNDSSNWDIYLPQAVFAANISKNRTSGFSPFELLFGRSPSLPIRLFDAEQYDFSYATDHELNRVVTLQNQVHKDLPGTIGDNILIRAKNASKLEAKWLTGFKIVAKRFQSYKVTNGQYTYVVHASNCKLLEDE